MGIFQNVGAWMDQAAKDIAQFATEKALPALKEAASEVGRRASLAGKAIVSPDTLTEVGSTTKETK